MMQSIILAILLLTSVPSFGQWDGKVRRSEKKEPDFATTAEQEDYWTKRLYKFHYKSKEYKRFQGKITRIDSATFQFDDILVKQTDADERLIRMLQAGILFPWMHGLSINMWGELTDLNPSYKVKRFRLSVYRENSSNPIVYFIELTNREATPGIGIMRFIDGSSLTFMKEGWVMM